MKKKIEAKITTDSIDPRGNRLITYLATLPRFILPELATHRMFSKNSASSRAIPFEKMVEMVETDPFIPIAWQKPHKGMQGTEYYDHTLTEEVGGLDYTNLPRRWLRARDTAVSIAKIMADEKGNMPVTKQLCNRLLEPFMWHTVLITATEFENFFGLRCPRYHYDLEDIYFRSKKDWLKYYKLHCIGNPNSDFDLDEMDWLKIDKSQAEIHIQALAEAMWDAKNESIPKQLKEGEYHIPFSDNMDENKIETLLHGPYRASYVRKEGDVQQAKIEIATARCARLSYMNFDGEIEYEKDLKLHDQLLEQGHFSPFEHCARVMSNTEYYSLFKGELNISDEDEYNIYSDTSKENLGFGWANNFNGFIPYRYMIENNYKI